MEIVYLRSKGCTQNSFSIRPYSPVWFPYFLFLFYFIMGSIIKGMIPLKWKYLLEWVFKIPSKIEMDFCVPFDI